MTTYPGGVKEFAVYTGLRIVLFLASLGVVSGIWLLVAGEANPLLCTTHVHAVQVRRLHHVQNQPGCQQR